MKLFRLIYEYKKFQNNLKDQFFLLSFRHLYGIFRFIHQSRCPHRSFFMKRNLLVKLTKS